MTQSIPSVLQVGLKEPKVTSKILKGDKAFPNNEKLPLLIYQGAFELLQDDPASQIEAVFDSNVWGGIWRNGIYSYHHYHSNAHEVLACYSGSAYVQFGGPSGITVSFDPGDVVIIPAGVAHKNISASANFRTVGAYPHGQNNYDLRRGLPGERPKVDDHIARVPLPASDPVYGASGPMVLEWHLIDKSRKPLHPPILNPNPNSKHSAEDIKPSLLQTPSPGKFSVRENR